MTTRASPIAIRQGVRFAASGIVGITILSSIFFLTRPAPDSGPGGSLAKPKLDQTNTNQPQPDSGIGKPPDNTEQASSRPMDLSTKDPVIVKATQRYIVELNKIEAKNARVFYEEKDEKSELVAVALSAPTPEDLAALTESLTSILAGVEPSREKEVREYLVWYYNEYTLYDAAYRVLHLRFLADEPGSALTISHFNDLSKALPNEKGVIHIEGGSRTSYSTSPTTGWRPRYGHLFEISDDEGQAASGALKSGAEK